MTKQVAPTNHTVRKFLVIYIAASVVLSFILSYVDVRVIKNSGNYGDPFGTNVGWYITILLLLAGLSYAFWLMIDGGKILDEQFTRQAKQRGHSLNLLQRHTVSILMLSVIGEAFSLTAHAANYEIAFLVVILAMVAAIFGISSSAGENTLTNGTPMRENVIRFVILLPGAVISAIRIWIIIRN